MAKVTREDVVADVRVVMNDVEALLKQAAEAGGAQAQELCNRAAASVRRGQVRLRELQGAVVENTRAAAGATDEWVHERPWSAIGIAAGIGFLAGLLISNRRS